MAPAGKHEGGAWVFVCWHLPDTFVEDVEFIICQTFFLEDSYDGIVDAATWNTQTCVSAQSRMLKTAFSAAWQQLLRTCSRWHWPPPSSASLLCPLVNFSRSSPAHWDWASSSTWAGAESSWRRHGQIQRHTKYGTAYKEGQAKSGREEIKKEDEAGGEEGHKRHKSTWGRVYKAEERRNRTERCWVSQKKRVHSREGRAKTGGGVSCCPIGLTENNSTWTDGGTLFLPLMARTIQPFMQTNIYAKQRAPEKTASLAEWNRRDRLCLSLHRQGEEGEGGGSHPTYWQQRE